MQKKDLEFYRKRRLEKRKQRQSKQNKQVVQLSVVAAVLVVGVIIGIALISRPSVAKIKSTVAKKGVPKPSKNIIMAKADGLELRLPVEKDKLTTIGYHEAFNPQSLTLKPKGKEVNTKRVNKQRLNELKNATNNLIYSIMWRSGRSGPLNSSVDVGSTDGTLNFSPVSGTIARIRKYKLYGRYNDVEIHILPKGFSDRHVVAIHAGDVEVKVGDKLVAGVTPIGRTRRFSDYFKQQLSDYSKDLGNHVHYQVNKLVNGKCNPDI
ncbi:MAG TPA: hypothetical protein ENH57_02500 [Actinobacteria bacterium]|nr:hypothetical protein [Actinomycetota bacterium]